MYAHQIQGKGGEVVTVVEDHICAGDSIFFGGQFISQSGIYIDTLTSYMGCDSIVELHLAVLPAHHAYREIYLCAGDSVFFGGRVLKEPGIYRDTLPTYMGCDSTMELKLNVIPNYYFYDTITMYEGESYSWRGKTIMAAGDYYDYYQTVDYCDSVYALHVNLIKMCSWKVESKDITMGAVSTTFHASAYPYGTQIKVEALPNSGYKFVKWNDGKKYNPYTFTILDDKYLMAIFMEEEVEPDTTVVVPTVSTVTVTWPVVEDSYRYSLTIYLDAACTIPFCTVTFDASGRVLDISFAQQAPSRLRRQVEGFTYTVPGLDAATKYYYKMEATDVEGKLLNTDEGDFETKADIGTALDETETVSAPAKILRNGHVLILRGDKTYTVTGAEVK